jgi:hypothetical protein
MSRHKIIGLFHLMAVMSGRPQSSKIEIQNEFLFDQDYNQFFKRNGEFSRSSGQPTTSPTSGDGTSTSKCDGQVHHLIIMPIFFVEFGGSKPLVNFTNI